MNIAESLLMAESKIVRWSGIAAIIGGVLLTVATTTFALTHGTQSAAKTDTLLGISSLQFARVFQPTIWLLFTVGVIGVNHVAAGHGGRWGRIGYRLSVLGYGLGFVSWIMQVWIVDPNRNFDSLFVQGGFSLWLIALLFQTVGMTLFGIALLRANAPTRWHRLPLLIGLLTPVAVFGDLYVFDTSDGSFVWTIIYVLLVVPGSLCWLFLGHALLSETNTP